MKTLKNFKKLIIIILLLFLSIILIIQCKSIYGYDEEDSASRGSGLEGFPSWYLNEEEQKTSYIQGPTVVFKSRGGNKGGNNTQIYHIPAIIVADNGNIIAFGDNRHNSSADVGTKNGPIDIVYKISKDGGKTWGVEKTILPVSPNDDMTGITNKGDVSVFKCLNGKLVALAVSGGGFANGANAATPSRMVMSKSLDNGETWSKWKEVGRGLGEVYETLQSKNIPRAFATSGRGTTLSNGYLATAMTGNYRGTPNQWLVFYLYSDDEGETWKVHPNMNTAKGDWLVAEPKIVGELDNGDLLMSVRNGRSSKGQVGKARMYGYSTDKGVSWGTFDSPSSGKLGNWNNMLCGNVDSEGIIWTRKSEHDKTRILHLLTGPNFRRGMAFWLSEDDGRSFREVYKVINVDAFPNKYNAGYNSIDVLGDGTIVTLAEEYNESNTVLGTADYDLVFRRYNMKAITGEVYQTNWYKNIK